MRRFLLAALILALIGTTTLMADTFYINSSSGNDTTGDGSSGTPWATITKGITEAISGDTLNITGMFTGKGVATDGIIIAKTLTITGQGADSTIVQAASTVATADRRTISIYTGSTTVTLKNITIRNGRVWEGVTDPYGGGVDITSGATVIIQKCHILDNRSWLQGGGISVYQSNLTLENSTVSGNLGYHGGGVKFQQSTGTITNCTVFDNYADASGYSGGVESTDASTITITNCTIANNTSTNAGGGIAISGTTLYIKNTILGNNTGNGTANDFDFYDGTVNDNGYNIVEFSTGHTFSGSGDITGSQANLNLASSLASNGTTNGTPTLALSTGSVAIDAANNTANNGVAIPTTDQRDASRDGTTDIGSYEFNGALSIELVSFTATALKDAILLEWVTASEIDTAGYEIWRSDGKSGQYKRMTKELIPAEGGIAWGAEYEALDSRVHLGRIYFYLLAEVSDDGGRTFHGPVSAGVGIVHLP